MKKFHLILLVLTVLLLFSSQSQAVLIPVGDIMILVPDIVTEGDPTIEDLGIGAIAQPPQAKSLAGHPLQFFYTWQIHHADGSVITLPESDDPNISFYDLQPYALSELSVQIRISDGLASIEVSMSSDRRIEIPDDIETTTVHEDTAVPVSSGLSLVTPWWWQAIPYEIIQITGKRCVERHPLFRHCTKEDYRTTSPFSIEETKKIHQAMSIVGQRMLSPEILDCALQRSDNSEWTTSGYAVTQSDFRRFVESQMEGLRHNFPKVFIYEHTEPRSPDVVANAFIGYLYSNGSTRREGNLDQSRLEFRVVKTKITSNSVTQLAGAFAHELMHQLGHTHPNDDGGPNRPNNEGRDSFIYTFGDCVSSDLVKFY